MIASSGSGLSSLHSESAPIFFRQPQSRSRRVFGVVSSRERSHDRQTIINWQIVSSRVRSRDRQTIVNWQTGFCPLKLTPRCLHLICPHPGSCDGWPFEPALWPYSRAIVQCRPLRTAPLVLQRDRSPQPSQVGTQCLACRLQLLPGDQAANRAASSRDTRSRCRRRHIHTRGRAHAYERSHKHM